MNNSELRKAPFNVRIFADGADLEKIILLDKEPLVAGITTNPTLLKQSGVKDYRLFAKSVLECVKEKPVSFEVFADSMREMIREAKEIASWGKNVFVKIPITNTKGESTNEVIEELVREGVKINVTAIMTVQQVSRVAPIFIKGIESYISIFAGRIADTGVDPIPVIKDALRVIQDVGSDSEIIWASPREVLNVVQANEIGCHVITATPEIIKKLELFGKNLSEYSLETVKMFFNDANQSGLVI